MYFDEFSKKLKEKGPPYLVFFFGDAEGVMAEGYEAVRKAFLKGDKGGSVLSFDGTQQGMGEVLGAAQTTGLFSTGQLIVLRHAEKALGGQSDAALQALKAYFKDPNPATRMVFLAPGMRKTAKAVSAAEGLGWTVQCAEIPDWKMPAWIKEQAQARGLALGEDGAQLLVEKVGTEMAYLQRALDQLVLYVHPRKDAAVRDVADLPAPGVVSEIFPFLDAVGLRRPEEAIALLNRLEDGVDAGTVIMLYQRMRELLLICTGREKGLRQDQMGERLGLNPYRLKMVWDQAAQYSSAELKKALMDLIHLQAGVVTGRLGKGVPPVVLEMWILKLRKGTAPARR
jgi:DNA polymerase III subunit delta